MLTAWKLLPALVLLGGCYGGVESEDNPVREEERPWPVEEASETRPLRAAQHCPVRDDTVRVELEEHPQGAALTFHTPGDVEALQERVHALADAYATQQERPLSGSTHRPPVRAEGEGTPSDALPAAHVLVEDRGDGARIVVTGSSPESVQRVRDTLRVHHQRLQRGECVGPMGAGT